jgi:hypothetical protein
VVQAAAGAPEHRPERRAGEQERADEHEEDAGQERPGGPEGDPDRAAEELAEIAALVLAERDHQAAAEHGEPRAERAHLDERAPHHHERADRCKRDRDRVFRVPDEPVEPVAEPAADVAAVPAEVEDGAEEEPERDRAEAPELRVLAACPRAALRPRLLDAARQLRAQLPLPLARHAPSFARRGDVPARRAWRNGARRRGAMGVARQGRRERR